MDHIQHFEQVHRVATKDGTIIWVINKGKVTLRSKNGDALRMVGTITDITKTKQSQQHLQEKNQELRRLNAIMVNREIKMSELKKELKELQNKLDIT